MGGHTHTVPDVTDGTGSTARDTGSTNPPLTHSHVSNPASGTSATNTSGQSVDTDSGDHRPPYYEVIFIKPNTNPAAGIPNNAVVIWDTASIPSGFNLADGASGRPDMRLRFLRGAATSGDSGGTGGATTHTHTIASHTHGGTISHTHSGSTSAANSTASTTGSISGAQVGTATASHTHALTFAAGSASITGATDSTNSANNLPPYRKEAFIQNTSGGTITDELMPRGIIALWIQSLASIPEGWVLCDGTQGTPDLRDTYVYGANTTSEVGNTGGSFTHSAVAVGHVHALGSHNHAITMASGAGENRTAGATNAPTTAHTHAGWTNTGSTAPNSGSTAPTYNDATVEPSYKTVAFIMRKEESVALAEQVQVWPLRRADTRPVESAPVFVPVGGPTFYGDEEQVVAVFDRDIQYPGTQAPVFVCPDKLMDWWGVENQDDIAKSYIGHNETVSQGFIPTFDGPLRRVTLQLSKVGSPVGTVQVILYSASGTWPNVTPNAIISGTVQVNVANITGTPTLVDFVFPDLPVLSQSTPYCIVIQQNWFPSNSSNYIAYGLSIWDTPGHAHTSRPTKEDSTGVPPYVALQGEGGSTADAVIFYAVGVDCDLRPQFFDAEPHRRFYPDKIPQQPPSVSAPVFVSPVVEVPFFECTSVQIFREKIAQQPDSIVEPVPVDIRETFERAWEPSNVIPFRPKAIPQQPPARAGPDFIAVPMHFLLAPTEPQQVRPPRRAQQPPSFTESPFPIPSTFFEVWREPQERFYAKRIAQQPDSLTKPVGDPFTYWEAWRQAQERYYALRRAQQPPPESAPPFMPTYFDAGNVQVRKRIWAQQPPSSCEPVFVETVPEEFFEDWQTPFDFYYRKGIAQQPPSESKPVATIPDTYFEAWRSAQERYYPKSIAQQPPSETGLVFTPGTPVAPTFFDAPQAQVFPRRWAQQPPSTTQPVATIPSTFFEAWRQAQERFYPKALPQHTPLVFVPLVPLTWTEGAQAQVFPRRWAQQPPSESAPVLTETVPREFFEDWQTPFDRFYPKPVPQQPPSESAPVATLPSTFFEVWRSQQAQVVAPERAQQPASESAPFFTTPAAPTYFACDSVQIFIPRRAQQPASETRPVGDPFTYWDAWENRQEHYYAKRIAQQPPSEAKPEATLPSTFFDAWENKQDRFYPKAVPQQPPSIAEPERDPINYYDAWENRQERFYPKGKPTQPPSTTQPEATLPSTFFEAWRSQDVRYYPKAIAQQPPSEAAPIVARQVIYCTGIPSEEAWGNCTVLGGLQPPTEVTGPGGVVIVRRPPRPEEPREYVPVYLMAASSSGATTRAQCAPTAACGGVAAASPEVRVTWECLCTTTAVVADVCTSSVAVRATDPAILLPRTGTAGPATADAPVGGRTAGAFAYSVEVTVVDDTMLGGDGMLIGYPR